MTVSIELFVLYNAVMNALLLFLTGRLSGLRARIPRLLCGAGLGALYAVASCLEPMLFLQEWYCKLLCAGLMATMVFLPAPPRRLLRAAVSFFVAAFLLGGTGFSLMYLMGARGYGWELASLLAVVGACACVALTCGIRRSVFTRSLRQVQISYQGETITFTALVDTGNRLTEPMSGLPVLVVEQGALGNINIPDERSIPFRAMGGEGFLPTFEPDNLYVNNKDALRMRIAVYPKRLSSDGQYAALLPWPYSDLPQRETDRDVKA